MSKYYRVQPDKFHYRDVSDTTDVDGKITSTTSLSELGVFRLVFFVIIIVTFGSVLFSPEPLGFTFRSFLEMLQNAPSIESDFTIDSLTITGDWGVFNFLKTFLNWNLKPIAFVLFLVKNLINVLMFLFYFLSYIF